MGWAADSHTLTRYLREAFANILQSEDLDIQLGFTSAAGDLDMPAINKALEQFTARLEAKLG
ncbi:hypothetical protein CHLRE_02g141006v5 [Chlamydomonas reinhardtii]|uniref:Uncharacterized protein n=1 Tax=Chlamydomonas reinhardtii TaxID=3055 RepID=A0A2K3E473_CHLRE|nr:uncharacterized protein CHLRE_02g141006v5 [Chlamydomonas reinhardtii]PNW87573.1 hypothetical protein CHLRE_02g141006v5 [Chlamydomonas reinhardtii]